MEMQTPRLPPHIPADNPALQLVAIKCVAPQAYSTPHPESTPGTSSLWMTCASGVLASTYTPTHYRLCCLWTTSTCSSTSASIPANLIALQ